MEVYFVGLIDLRLQAQVYVAKQVAHMAFDMIYVAVGVKHVSSSV